MAPAPSRPPASRAFWRGLVAGGLLHTAAVGWVAWRWSPQLRGTVLTLIDLPLSLFFAGAVGGSEIVGSLLFGGIQWALIAGLLGLGVERLTRPKARPAA